MWNAFVPVTDTAESIPRHIDLLMPTLDALKDLGGSARIDELLQRVAEREGFTDEQISVRRSPDHHMGLIEYRLAWARNYLKNIGAIENSARGVWTITPLGREIKDANEAETRVKAYKAEYNKAYYEAKRLRPSETPSEDDETEDAEAQVEVEIGWKERLLDRLLAMPPDAFERLAQRLLKEAGFRNVEVLGKSGDGGIDGVGVYRLSLVSFPVFFQCKRWKGTVRPTDVRDFRGAMAGRGEKGLLITTGTFSKDAKAEATRDGAPPVELIDGDDLCDLLKEYEIGVKTTTRVVEEVAVDADFFGAL
jgi:restriction system protein